MIIGTASFPNTPPTVMAEIDAILESIFLGHWGWRDHSHVFRSPTLRFGFRVQGDSLATERVHEPARDMAGGVANQRFARF